MKDALYTIWGIILYYVKYKYFLNKDEKEVELFQFKKLKKLF